jgi:hypothetical protein
MRNRLPDACSRASNNRRLSTQIEMHNHKV